MIFDLKGKRRRFVQGTYLTLAVLMGGGLVLFGIGGGSLNGGLLNAFTGGGGSSSGNKQIQQRIDNAQKQLAANPQNQAALQEIIRDNYQLANLNADQTTGVYTDKGKQYLQQASSAWQRYLASSPANPNVTLASQMTAAYQGLGDYNKAEKAALIVAAAQPSSAAYLRVVQYASLAKPPDTRTVNLASQKALDLAPKGQRSSVRKQIQAVKATATGTPTQTGTGTTGG
jgi:tetratricopeptide (TPR) repeat protein